MARCSQIVQRWGMCAALLVGPAGYARPLHLGQNADPTIQNFLSTAKAKPSQPASKSKSVAVSTSKHKPVPIVDDRSIAYSGVGTGLVTAAHAGMITDQSRGEDQIRHNSIELTHPEDIRVPSIVTDLNNIFMGEELMRQVEDDIKYRLGSAVVRDTRTSDDMRRRLGALMLHNQVNYQGTFYSLHRDTRLGRPYELTYEEERNMRSGVANSMKGYMRTKGVIKFLASRKQTKQLAQSYEKAINITKIEFTRQDPVTKVVWRYSTGVNFFQDAPWIGGPGSNGWFLASTDDWVFEYRQSMKTLLRTGDLNPSRVFDNYRLLVERTIHVRGQGDYRLSSPLFMPSWVWNPSVSHSFTSRVSAGLDASYPLKARDVLYAASYGVSMLYSF